MSGAYTDNAKTNDVCMNDTYMIDACTNNTRTNELNTDPFERTVKYNPHRELNIIRTEN